MEIKGGNLSYCKLRPEYKSMAPNGEKPHFLIRIQLLEEETELPIVQEPAQEPSKMDTDEYPADPSPLNTSETDVNMQDPKAEGATAENTPPESGDKPVQMETDAKVEAPKKKITKKDVPVSEVVYGGLAAADLEKSVEKEFEMALQDRVMEETKDKKNAVEAYVYEMRNKLNDKYHDFVTGSEKEQLISTLQEVEDWLYEDGEDESKGVYTAKLEDLKKQGDPIEARYKEHTERGSVLDQFIYCINSYREAAKSSDPKFEHIDLADKQKVLDECAEVEAWLREKKQHQDTLPKYATPTLLSADVRKKAEALDRFCRPIMMKPKPAKPATTPEPPSAATSQGDKPQSQGAENVTSSTTENADAKDDTGGGYGNEVPWSAAEPMETDKSESAPPHSA
ncbi:hypothetical protein OROGR_030456 [Orobanche gracilis]